MIVRSLGLFRRMGADSDAPARAGGASRLPEDTGFSERQRLRRGFSASFLSRAAVALLLAVTGIGLQGCNESSNDANSLVGSPSGAKEVHFKTVDNWDIFGDAYVPVGASKGVVILLHQRNGAASDWKSLCGALRTAGFTALAIDQRGAGRSVQGPGGVGGKGDSAPWETGPDIEAAIKYLAGKGPVALVGASYGANNVLIYAAAHPEQIRSVVLFSPGIDYNGLDALTAAKKWRGPLEIFHDKGDSIAGDGPKTIDLATPSTDHKLVVTARSRHGTDLIGDALSNSAVSPVTFLLRTVK